MARLKASSLLFSLGVIVLSLVITTARPGLSQQVRGTLVVAVPVQRGLVVCSDKRLYNADAGTFTDDNVKIRQAGRNSLFVATNTVAFYDTRSRKIAFDASDVTAAYVAKHEIADEPAFWNGLKKEIGDSLRDYFSKRKFAEWPASDQKNNNLLFNLIFYAAVQNEIRGYSLEVFYKKAETPEIYFSGPAAERVKFPKLSGKGREVISRLAGDPVLSRDPSVLRFDETVFDASKASTQDAIAFSRKLFAFANASIPSAQVSSSFDCSLISFDSGFQWLKTK